MFSSFVRTQLGPCRSIPSAVLTCAFIVSAVVCWAQRVDERDIAVIVFLSGLGSSGKSNVDTEFRDMPFAEDIKVRRLAQHVGVSDAGFKHPHHVIVEPTFAAEDFTPRPNYSLDRISSSTFIDGNRGVWQYFFINDAIVNSNKVLGWSVARILPERPYLPLLLPIFQRIGRHGMLEVIDENKRAGTSSKRFIGLFESGPLEGGYSDRSGRGEKYAHSRPYNRVAEGLLLYLLSILLICSGVVRIYRINQPCNRQAYETVNDGRNDGRWATITATIFAVGWGCGVYGTILFLPAVMELVSFDRRYGDIGVLPVVMSELKFGDVQTIGPHCGHPMDRLPTRQTGHISLSRLEAI
jgi:hypothetical protein